MSQPTPYTPNADFSQQEANNASGRSTVNTAALDAEFAAIDTTLDQTLANLQLIQRDDGKLGDVLVEVRCMAPDTLNLIGGFELTGLWVAATSYQFNDICSNGEYTYVCKTAHTSGGSFDASKWTQFGFTSGADAAQAAAAAQVSANAAAVSDTNANLSKLSAASSEIAAASYASSASSNASTASTKAGEALASAANAANYAASLPNVVVAGPSKVIISNATGTAWDYKTYQQVVEEVDTSYRGSEQIGHISAGVGAVATTVLTKLRELVSVKDFGAKGDNVTDDFAAIQSAITYCQSNQSRLHFGEGSYALSAQLVVTGTFDITCEKTSALRWTSTSSSGILFDFTTNDDSLCQIDLPQLFSAGVDSSFNIPGYAAGSYTYNLANRYGNAVELRGGNRITMSVHYACGWQSAVLVKASSARNPENHSINFNTIDFCVYGCKADGGTSGSNGISSLVFNVNTCWAKYPIYVDGTTGYVIASKFSINGQTFINEPDGCCVYGSGTHIDTCKFFSNWTSAGKQADSTSGVSATLINPFIGGNQTSNGLTTDGNATIGYFGGTFCEFNIGAVMGIPGGYGASSVPAAGHTIRVRDAGSYNKVRIDNSDSLMTSPISTTTTAGEANYNGGVGGAQYSNKVFCSASVPALPPLNGTVNHYIYHQCISQASRKPIKVYPMDSTLANQGLMMYATDNSNSANRQIIIQFVNPSGTRTTGATTVDFIVELP